MDGCELAEEGEGVETAVGVCRGDFEGGGESGGVVPRETPVGLGEAAVEEGGHVGGPDGEAVVYEFGDCNTI